MRSLNPFYYLLRYVILRRFFSVDLDDEEMAFVEENIDKHARVLFINVIAGILIFKGIAKVDPKDLGGVVAALLGPVMVMGGAWFAISFGGIPAKLIDVAMAVTFWMFTAFTTSFTAMFITVMYITPMIIWPVFGIVYVGALCACMQYDTADGLKAGLDEAVLHHSRAAIAFYRRKGIGDEIDKGTETN